MSLSVIANCYINSMINESTRLAILAMAKTRPRIIGRVEVHFILDLAIVTRAGTDHNCDILSNLVELPFGFNRYKIRTGCCRV